jgi:hypothetical protein
MIYAHQWLPIPAVVAALFILCAPYLGLIALVVIVFVAVATLVTLGGTILAGLHVFSRSVRWRTRTWRQATEGGPEVAAVDERYLDRGSPQVRGRP